MLVVHRMWMILTMFFFRDVMFLCRLSKPWERGPRSTLQVPSRQPLDGPRRSRQEVRYVYLAFCLSVSFHFRFRLSSESIHPHVIHLSFRRFASVSASTTGPAVRTPPGSTCFAPLQGHHFCALLCENTRYCKETKHKCTTLAGNISFKRCVDYTACFCCVRQRNNLGLALNF